MDRNDFRAYAHQVVDWMADYLENVEDLAVKASVGPGEIRSRLAHQPPSDPEPFEQIFADFKQVIMPGMTHWQHPGYMAYFPANSSPPSILAEMITATLAAQCMIWDTSPAAAELEEEVMAWLQQMLGLPNTWHGVIQDTASTATLCAILTARERQSQWQVNESGLTGQRYRVYASGETHSSIEKSVKIAGLGSVHLVKVPVDEHFRLDPGALERAIAEDVAAGYQPLCVVATIGTTGVTAIDPVRPVAEICQRHQIWLHIDAAYAGTALILPEYRWMIDGLELADSFVFNPHKWMFTNFDCTAYFVKDREALLRTFEILPEYLKTSSRGQVSDFRDWGIPLGRRFRALKLWFVIRTYGLSGLQSMIQAHIDLAKELEAWIRADHRLEIMAPRTLNLVAFRYHGEKDQDALDQRNRDLLHAINSTGNFYLTHTKVREHYTLRVVIGQTYVERSHVKALWKCIQDTVGTF